MPADRTKDQNHADADPVDRPAAGVPMDRRRPGRLQQVSPELIDLLRSRPKDGSIEPGKPRDDEWGSLRAARGILLAAVVGVGLWAGLYWIVKYWLIGLLLR